MTETCEDGSAVRRQAGWRSRMAAGVCQPAQAGLMLVWLAMALIVAAGPAAADAIVASVNGKPILESELALADAEIGADLGSLPAGTKRRVLVEYLIETQLMADAAEAARLVAAVGIDRQRGYWHRKALRDAYFENKVKSLVTEADARRQFDLQVGNKAGQTEVKARHILVENEDKAKEIVEQIVHGADFTAMARQHSKDPGSRDIGGSLGYFSRGQMVPQFEDEAFKLERGEVSQPVKSQFGWHIIMVDDKRVRQATAFEGIKKRIMAGLVHQKTIAMVEGLRARARIDYIDPQIRAHIEAEQARGRKRQ